MRLEPLEVYVLDSFRLQRRTFLRFEQISERCTINRRNALDDAIARLEDESLVVRCFDFVELTDAGEQFLAMAGPDAREHRLEP